MAAITPPGNPLSGQNLSHIIAASLPRESPTIKKGVEAIALAAHASLLSVGFRLVGLGEDHKLDAQSDATDTQPLPSEWNAHSGSYAFRYKHSQSSMEFLLKITSMGNKVIINAMGMGDDRPLSVDVKVSDYVSEGNLPVSREASDQSQTAQQIVDLFISIGRLSDLGSLMRVLIIQKLLPSLQKEGYQETSESDPSERRPAPGREDDAPTYDPLREERDPPARPYPLHDPLAQPRGPRRPIPEPIPGFEDEHELQRPLRGGFAPGGFGVPRIGERDLYPQGLGPNDPFRGGGGVGPGFGGPRGGGGGGMHPTFDDPLFAGRGPRGGDEFDPQAPPGARFDPPFGPGMGGRGPNPFGGFGDGDFI